MKIFDLIPSDYYSVIADYAKIFIPSFITYLITRYSLSKPRKYSIKEKQLEQVYLPLYLLTQQYFSESNNKFEQNVPIYIKKVDKIIRKNFVLVYPKTLKLFNDFKKKQSFQYFFPLQNQIEFDYEKLKRELGYPSKSFIEIFRRLTTLDKTLYTIYFVFSVISLSSAVTSFRLFMDRAYKNALSSLFLSAILALFLYILWHIKLH